jgi:hypothetical protein
MSATIASWRDPRVEPRGDLVGVRPGADDVVATGRDRDEVGAQLEGGIHLLVEDLLQQPAADREVGVGEVGGAAGEHLGDAVGPAAVAAGSLGLRVADPLGEGVADRDVARPGMTVGHAVQPATSMRHFHACGPESRPPTEPVRGGLLAP